MRAILSVFWIFFYLGVFAQESAQLEGRVFSGEIPVESVAVENISQIITTMTDSTGYFEINAKAGDTLFFSEKNVVPKRLILTSKTLGNNLLNIHLDPIVNQLDEALVYSNRNINAVALGIIPKEVKPLTINEKRLLTAGDFKAIDLLGILGGGVPINPIINKISGRTKRLKKIVAQERIAIGYERLKENYSVFIADNLHISEADMGKFLYFLADDTATLPILDMKDENRTQLYILEKGRVFQNK